MLKLNFQNEAYQALDLSQPRITVGREKANDVVLTEDGVSGFHAEILCEDGKVFLLDLGSTNGTFVNGEKITGRQEVKAWDVVKFDKLEAEVVDTERRRPTVVRKAVTDDDLAGKKTQIRPATGGWTLRGSSGAAAGNTVPLAGKTSFGRDAACDVTLDDTMISGRHAEIDLASGVPVLRDLDSTNGTFVNGRQINQPMSLKDGDEVRFDKSTFKVQGTADTVAKTQVRPAVDAAATQVRPTVATGGGTRLSAAVGGPSLEATGGKKDKHGLSGSRITVGRSESNDIVLNDDTVSGSHAVLTVDGDAWTVTDQGSSNGTYVNGKKVEHANLKPGDKVQFGEVEFQFVDPVAGSGAGTRVMPSAATKTSVSPAAKKGMPAWVFGLIGFVAVAVVFAGLYAAGFLGSSTSQTEAELQASKAWSQDLSGRKMPATPAICDVNGDKFLDVIVADSNGFVMALDGVEGKVIFEAEAIDRILASPVAGDLSGDGIDDVVVASNSGIVLALNGKGQTLWKSEPSLNLGDIFNRPVLAELNGDGISDVVVPTANKGLVALDGAHGWEIWNTTEMTRGKTITSPVRADINRDGNSDFVALTDDGHVLAVTSQKGKVWKIWDAQVPAINYASPLYLDLGEQGLIVVASKSQGLVALNAENGRMAWTAKIEKDFFASPIAVDANGDKVPDVLAVSFEGDIHVLDALTGDEIWSAALGVKVQATPALFDLTGDGLKDLVLLDSIGNIRVIGMARGREELGVGIPDAGGFIASPVLGDVNNDAMIDVVTAGQSGIVTVHTFNRVVGKGQSVWPVFLGNDQHGL